MITAGSATIGDSSLNLSSLVSDDRSCADEGRSLAPHDRSLPDDRLLSSGGLSELDVGCSSSSLTTVLIRGFSPWFPKVSTAPTLSGTMCSAEVAHPFPSRESSPANGESHCCGSSSFPVKSGRRGAASTAFDCDRGGCASVYPSLLVRGPFVLVFILGMRGGGVLCATPRSHWFSGWGAMTPQLV